MKHSTSATLYAAVLLTGCVLQSACAQSSPTTGPAYDFDWHLSGAAEVRPYQVFDDGQKLYLQFDDLKRVPAIFADTAGGRILLRWRPDPPYIIVDQMERALVFRAGSREALAVRAVPDGPPDAAHFGAVPPEKVIPATSPPAPGTTAPSRTELLPPGR